jgi:tetratricopeptide (TPR) repeat protein
LENYKQAEAELIKLIQEDKSLEAKQLGYQNLVNFYPYVGKYQDLLDIMDKRIDWARGQKDSTGIAHLTALKALYLQRKFNDGNVGWDEVSQIMKSPIDSKNLLFWATISLLYVNHGDYQLADSVAKSISTTWWFYTIRCCIYSQRHECQKAEIYADSVMNGGPGFCKIVVLNNLAECQYEMEKYIKAEKNLLLLQEIKDQSFGLRSIYYPKSYYLLGEVYEEMGEIDLSIKNYQRFLNLWKDGDQDLPELIDGKRRLAMLVGNK